MAKPCKAKTLRGTRCPNPAGSSGYCFTHDPVRARARARARKRGGERRRVPKVAGPAVEIKTLKDVLALVNKVILDTWELENSPARSRVLIAAAAAATNALKVGEIEERLAAIERALNPAKA